MLRKDGTRGGINTDDTGRTYSGALAATQHDHEAGKQMGARGCDFQFCRSPMDKRKGQLSSRWVWTVDVDDSDDLDDDAVAVTVSLPDCHSASGETANAGDTNSAKRQRRWPAGRRRRHRLTTVSLISLPVTESGAGQASGRASTAHRTPRPTLTMELPLTLFSTSWTTLSPMKFKPLFRLPCPPTLLATTRAPSRRRTPS